MFHRCSAAGNNGELAKRPNARNGHEPQVGRDFVATQLAESPAALAISAPHPADGERKRRANCAPERRRRDTLSRPSEPNGRMDEWKVESGRNRRKPLELQRAD